jgi:type II secretory pathway component GspD/PulD (secretin)
VLYLKISAIYKIKVLTAAAVMLFASGKSAAAPIPVTPAQSQMVQNVWVDIPLTQIFRDISMQTGTVIAACPHVPDQLISLDVGEPKPIQECLKELVAGRGLTVSKKREDFYLITCGNTSCPAFMEIADSQRIYLKYISAKHLMSSLPRPIQPYVSCGERTNEILVYAAQDAADNIKNIVNKLDIPQQQVVLEVLVVELDENGAEEFSLDWAYQDEHNTFAMKDGLGAFTSLAKYTSVPENEMTSILFTLRSLVAREKADIRARPRVATLNGQPASIEIMLDEYFTIVTDVYGPTSLLRTELQVIKSGVMLNIIPNIGDEGDITVDVLTEVSDVAARQNEIQGNKSGNLPIVKRRKASTKVRVKDGDAIVIGGLVETQQKNLDKRVPILSSIPIIGGIFTSKESATVNKEVVIFITPRIIKDGASPLADRNKKINVEQELKQLRQDPQAANCEKPLPDPNTIAACGPPADSNEIADGPIVIDSNAIACGKLEPPAAVACGE